MNMQEFRLFFSPNELETVFYISFLICKDLLEGIFVRHCSYLFN
jgi:hypothetical protein